MKRCFFLIAISVFACISSCKKTNESFDIQNMENKVIVLGHGGSGDLNFYPINTYESLLNCINSGADGSEWDIQMTKDSVLVAYHDETLETQTTGKGRIIDYTWSELQEFKYNPAPYVRYDIVSVDSLFAHVSNLKSLTFSFDNKLYFEPSSYPAFISAVIKVLEKYGMEQNVFIESHSAGFLIQFKQLKDYKFFLNPDNFDDGLKIIDSMNIYGIIMDVANISAAQIQEAHSHGKYVQVWGTSGSGDNTDAVKMNPDAIQTDDIASLVNLLK
ncbi:glycerophosphodiester phosphodiesterase family protein [Taibaiella lutea]|uniref:Glycerophosphodiester phosphodiesterase family protein n=2 Tax=Taibaiella lutea TaxID=2608001 RepID=A0A5M6CPC3_9BACT|nr:glycerophosphodiester phosphodiesterase family protein [Taibaiella lutea]